MTSSDNKDSRQEALASETQDLSASSQEVPTKRKRLGRSARRRRKKLLDIQQAEADIRQGRSSVSETTTSVLAVDRDRVWPAVLEKRKAHPWSTQDEAALVAQLGYVPGNAMCITAKSGDVEILRNDNCDTGVEGENVPVALQLYPIVLRESYSGGKANGRKFKGRKRRQSTTLTDSIVTSDDNPTNNMDESSSWIIEPFPTQFWLTHPLLRTLISRLELDGLGSRLERRLAESSKDLARMQRAHQAYGQLRHELLTNADWQMVQARNWQAAFDPMRGVAGIRNHGAVKCLHAHAGHYLSRSAPGSADNVIGEWVMQAVAKLVQSESERP